MKRRRHTEEQIIAILKEAESGLGTADLVRKNGISEQTFYRWKSKNGFMEVSEAKRLRQPEEENWQLKRLVADQELEHLGRGFGRISGLELRETRRCPRWRNGRGGIPESHFSGHAQVS